MKIRDLAIVLLSILCFTCKRKVPPKQDASSETQFFNCPDGVYPECPIPCLWQNIQTENVNETEFFGALNGELQNLRKIIGKSGGPSIGLTLSYLDTTRQALMKENTFSQEFIEIETSIRRCFCEQFTLMDSLDRKKNGLQLIKDCRAKYTGKKKETEIKDPVISNNPSRRKKDNTICKIIGIVKDATTEEVISEALVLLTCDSIYNTRTDENGFFTFEIPVNLFGDQCLIRAQYSNKLKEVYAPMCNPNPIELKLK